MNVTVWKNLLKILGRPPNGCNRGMAWYSEDFGDSEYSEEEFSSKSEGSPVYASPRCRPMTRTIPRGSLPRCGCTSGPSSVPGLRARMLRWSPGTCITPTRPRRGAAVTATTRATAAIDDGDGKGDRGNNSKGDDDGGKRDGDDKDNGGSSRPVAKPHWFKY
jgi:hypothetical protein